MSRFGEFIEAVQRGDCENVRRLCERKFINKRELGWTALHCACRQGNVEIVKYLLSEGGDIEEEAEEFGWRPIHFAVLWGHTSVLRTLIEAGCSLDCVSEYGETPLDVALRLEREEIVRILRSSMEEREKKKTALRQLKEDSLSKSLFQRALGYFGIHSKYESPQLKVVTEPTREPTREPRGAESLPTCSICVSEPINCTLNCGHKFCMTCAEKVIKCFNCQAPITARIKMFF